jgi:AcrR family transcriptional regulator
VAITAIRERKQRRTGAARRPELLGLAAEAFSEWGYSAASLRDIGQRAGIKAASFYHHFDNKEDLLKIIVFETLEDLSRVLLAELSRGTDAESRLRNVIRQHLLFACDHPDQTKVVFEEAHFLSKAHLAAVKEKQRMVLNIYRSLLNELKAQNKIAVADTTICALNALAMIHGFYRWYRPQGRLSREKLIDQTVALLFQGMRLHSPNGARIKKAKS